MSDGDDYEGDDYGGDDDYYDDGGYMDVEGQNEANEDLSCQLMKSKLYI